jgi:putative exporter of polyketide antibiotics
VPQMPSQGFTLTPVLALTSAAAALIAAGVAGFRHRDTGY